MADSPAKKPGKVKVIIIIIIIVESLTMTDL